MCEGGGEEPAPQRRLHCPEAQWCHNTVRYERSTAVCTLTRRLMAGCCGRVPKCRRITNVSGTALASRAQRPSLRKRQRHSGWYLTEWPAAATTLAPS